VPNWKKALRQMLDNPNPCNYRYEDAARVLRHLRFSEEPNSGTSHRKWRLAPPDRPVVVIGLVKKGGEPMKKVYILTMVRILQENNLLPADV
jgi:hypothetical protein